MPVQMLKSYLRRKTFLKGIKYMNNVNFNIYVFTTKNVLKKGYPIIRVIHERDGDWQFLGDECNLQEDDAMLVSLNEIVEFDKTLFDILTLSEGKQALRDRIGGDWHVFNIDF